MRDETKAALNNLGFILQVNGTVLFVITIVSLLFEEFSVSTTIAISASLSLIAGYLLTTFFKGGEMSFLSLCLLIVFTYITFGLIGSVPYFYIGSEIFKAVSPIDTFVSGLFESVSSYTTTGLTLVGNIDLLPRSVILLRSTLQWLGGINIVLLSLLFLISPSGIARSLAELSGILMIRPSVRSTFLAVMKVYTIYTVLFIPLLYLAGGVSLFDSINIVFTGLATGGFLPLKDLTLILNPVAYTIIMAIMILGALNFSIHTSLFGRRPRAALTSELLYFTVIILVSTIVILILIGPTTFASALMFHTVSAATTTGFQFIDIGQLSHSAKLALTLLMFIGGSTLSTAGGIKILRLIIALKGTAYLYKIYSVSARAILSIKLDKKVIEEREILQSLLLIFIAAVSIITSTLVFTLYGLPTIDSVFEVTSAYATTGLSTGITGRLTQPELKLLIIFMMILGRVEILPILTLIVRPLTRLTQRI